MTNINNVSSFDIHRLFLNQEMTEENSDSFATQFKKRIRVVKGIGILLMMIIACTTPGLIILGSAPHHIEQLDINSLHDIILNQTACDFIKQFDLRESIYLTVCNRDDFVILDIRRFQNQTASILGIPLNTQQWLQLKQSIRAIDAAISQAING
jgi:hypothetical protein